MRTLCVSVLIIATSTVCFSAILPDLPPKKQAFVEATKKLARDIGFRFQPFFEELLVDSNITTECIGSLIKTMSAARDNEEWALRILFSSGTIPTSLLDGGLASYGSFDQCRRARRYNSEGHLAFRGQWCAVTVAPDDDIVEHIKPLTSLKKLMVRTADQDKIVPDNVRALYVGLKVGICAPSLCEQHELNYIVNKGLSAYDLSAHVTGCQTDEAVAVTTTQKICLAYVLISFALLIAGTYVEWSFRKSGVKVNTPLKRILSFFSIRRNTRRLFRDPAESTNSSMQFINGLKVLLSFWIVVGHTYSMVQPDMIENFYDMFKITKSWIFQPVINTFVAVESFFFLSGFLLSYLTMANRQSFLETCKTRRISVVYILIFARRYIRTMIPALAMLAYSLLVPLLYDSPVATDGILSAYVGNCPNNWWKLPLLIGNLEPSTDMCVVHTWYLAVDMQIFVIGSAVALLLLYKPRVALSISGSLVVLSAVGTAYVTYSMNFSYIININDFNFERVMRTFDYVYIQAYPHFSNYFLGVMCGYTTAAYPRIFESKSSQGLMWLTSGLLAFYSLFGTVRWFREGFPDHIPGSFYAGVHRPLWGLALFWFTYACSTGRSGSISEILSHRSFTVLGRLSFGIYLMHMMVIAVKNGFLKGSVIYVNQFLELKDALGIFVISTFLAYYLNITVEAPVAALDDMFFGGLRRTRSKKNHKAPRIAGDRSFVINIQRDTLHTKM